MIAFSKAKNQMNTFIYNIIMGLSRSNYRLFFFMLKKERTNMIKLSKNVLYIFKQKCIM